MPRNISFSLTTQQFRDRSKTVTRRMGWKTLVAGVLLNGCEKCMGLKPGQKVVRLGTIKVVNTSREPLRKMIDDPEYGKAECVAEGFPELSPEQFVDMFCKSHSGCTPATTITRIEYEYLD